jgi:tetratricopeptide (TPR) repeat protein
MLKNSLNAIIWIGLSLFVAVWAYKKTDWYKPVADKATDQISAVVSKAPTGPFGQNASEKLLNYGRNAFVVGDFEGAVVAYKDFLKTNPDHADAYGELGNVYYLSGRHQDAAQNYYDSARLLIDQKQTDRIPALLPVIAQINPPLANEVAQNMLKVSSPTAAQAR